MRCAPVVELSKNISLDVKAFDVCRRACVHNRPHVAVREWSARPHSFVVGVLLRTAQCGARQSTLVARAPSEHVQPGSVFKYLETRHRGGGSRQGDIEGAGDAGPLHCSYRHLPGVTLPMYDGKSCSVKSDPIHLGGGRQHTQVKCRELQPLARKYQHSEEDDAGHQHEPANGTTHGNRTRSATK